MSCLISSAICCVLITSSLSGVALGYNYSLAEYIDLKETNVSVFIKRGVFDDDVVDDMMDFRRKGAPLRTLKDDGDLKTASDDQEQIPDARRRLDDSIIESNERNSFEGSLMKLTMKPPAPLSTEETTVRDDSVLLPILPQPPPGGSLDQLKAIQGIINARKAAAPRNPMEIKDDKDKDARRSGGSMYDHVDLLNMHNVPPNSPGGNLTNQFRRMMSMLNEPNVIRSDTSNYYSKPKPDMPPIKIHPARLAVPSGPAEMKWMMHDVPPEVYRRMMESGEDPPGKPRPITYSTGPIRPSTTKIVTFATPTRSPAMENTLATTEVTNPDVSAMPTPKIVGSENIDYYDDEVKGLPVRKRRHVQNLRKSKNAKSNKDFSVENSTINIVTSVFSNFKSMPVRTHRVSHNPTDTNNHKFSDEHSTANSTIKIVAGIFSAFKDLPIRKHRELQNNTNNDKLNNEVSTDKSIIKIVQSSHKDLPLQKHTDIQNPTNITNKSNNQSDDEVSTEKSTIKIVTDIFNSFKVGKTVSNEITVSPSVLVSKLHFTDKLVSGGTSPANEKAATNGTETTKTVEVAVNDTRTIRTIFGW